MGCHPMLIENANFVTNELREAEKPSPLYVTGKNKGDYIFGVDGGCYCLFFMYACGGSDGG